MKSLFNKYEAYNKEGCKVCIEIEKLLKPVFDKWADKGYKVTDIESISITTIGSIGAIKRMKKKLTDMGRLI